MNLLRRARAHEIMDDERVAFGEFAQTLRQLSAINRATLAHADALAAISRLIASGQPTTAPITVLDVGCGYGDLLRKVGAWAREKGYCVRLTGVDKSPWAAKVAAAANDTYAIEYITCDVFQYRPKTPFHIILSSQFLHHLPGPRIAQLLRWMARHARYGFFVTDLHRHPVAYYATLAVTRLLPFNRLIRHDAPLSVAKAFSRRDWEEVVRRAGLRKDSLQLHWRWPFRWSLTYAAQ